MSAREEFDALTQDTGWLGAIARAGRARRAAEDLAALEYEEGWHATVEEAPAEPVRLAADDGPSDRRFTDGMHVVVLTTTASTRVATQVEGPAGATLSWGDTPVPLTPHKPAPTPIGAIPSSLYVIDANGRRRVLREDG
jgi:hypothetical protein